MIRIALVDDEPEITDQIAGYIAQYYQKIGQGQEAYKLYIYRDGRELLQRFPRHIDIIFMDIEMQEVDGMTAAAKIRKVNQNVAIIFLTRLAQMAIKGYEVAPSTLWSNPSIITASSCALSRRSGMCAAFIRKSSPSPP